VEYNGSEHNIHRLLGNKARYNIAVISM
jgi:hypothetical protein